MAGFLSIVLILIAIILFINFPLAIIGLVIGTVIAGWGFNELAINKDLGAKSKKPITIVLVGLFIIIGGFSAQANGDETANVDGDSPSSETITEETEENENRDNAPASEETETVSEADSEGQEKNEEEEAVKKAAEKAAEKEAEEKKAAEEKAKADKERKESKANEAAKKKKKENETNATVTRVIDGDTIEINRNGTTDTVRLLLVDTPETVHPSKPVEPFGPEASQFVKDTLEGKEVYVKVGKEERDKYDRLLAYVFIDGETIQEKLLKKGLAATAYLYNDLTMLDEFHEAQQPAIDAGRGVWSISGYAHVDHNHGYHYEEEKNTNSDEAIDKSDKNCGDFEETEDLMGFWYKNGFSAENDPHNLDGDADGLPCEVTTESWEGFTTGEEEGASDPEPKPAPAPKPVPQPEPEPAPEPKPAPAPEPEPQPEPQPAAPSLQYDPGGPDRDCGDFSSHSAAQAFMEASGPEDPHRLDGNDNDGLACESLN